MQMVTVEKSNDISAARSQKEDLGCDQGGESYAEERCGLLVKGDCVLCSLCPQGWCPLLQVSFEVPLPFLPGPFFVSLSFRLDLLSAWRSHSPLFSSRLFRGGGSNLPYSFVVAFFCCCYITFCIFLPYLLVNPAFPLRTETFLYELLCFFFCPGQDRLIG